MYYYIKDNEIKYKSREKVARSNYEIIEGPIVVIPKVVLNEESEKIIVEDLSAVDLIEQKKKEKDDIKKLDFEQLKEQIKSATTIAQLKSSLNDVLKILEFVHKNHI